MPDEQTRWIIGTVLVVGGMLGAGQCGVRDRIGDMALTVNRAAGEVSEVRGEVSTLRGEVSMLRGEVGELRRDLGILTTDMQTVKDDVEDLTVKVQTVQDDVRAVGMCVASDIDVRMSVRARLETMPDSRAMSTLMFEPPLACRALRSQFLDGP